MSEFPAAQILDVDLSSKKISKRTLSAETYRLYPGGSALGLYLLLQDMPAGIDPLSPGNMLVMAVSPLTGLPISGLSRMTITTKSPLTGAIGDSQAGGFFPADLKANGWDAIIFRGRAEEPVYLSINGQEAELRDAGQAWGKVTGDAEKVIREDLGDNNLQIAQIGPAGENMVRYAAVLNMCNRANGRNGTGAVMGSKNLKAVVVRKKPKHKPVDREPFKKLASETKARIEENTVVSSLAEHGTDSGLIGLHLEGYLPTRNWYSGYFPEGAEDITGETMSSTILKGRDTCHACSVRCKRVVEVPGMVDPLYGGPEYETCGALGSYCGITSLEAIAKANQLCNMYGLDTISCGGTISFAMECYKKGLIDQKDTGGLQLTFGNEEVIFELIRQIAYKEGFGKLLAEGSLEAARQIGEEAVALSITAKGQELPAHMPQQKPSLGIIYAVNPFGADHQSSAHDTVLTASPKNRIREFLHQVGIWKGYSPDDIQTLDEEKVRFAYNTQCFYSLADSLCLCQFVWGPCWQLYGPSDLVDLCRSGLGWETSLYELMLVGERRINMMRFFNSREGFTREDDALPERLFKPLPDGPSEGVALNKEDFESAKDLYYKFAGWDRKTGNPNDYTFKKLSLDWLLRVR